MPLFDTKTKPDPFRYRSTLAEPGPISDFHRGCHLAAIDGCPVSVAFTCTDCGVALHVNAYRPADTAADLDRDRHDDAR